ncbi:amino acid transporter [Nocardioides sp. GY 10113]|uniref:AzlC family ABC transporter permease n=1 Tax=Nocardioides sp. GY 10113 TaxID=2569761 RepID=UPI0010A91AD3|nr:AzlC family ABC transporter permease [Nocardioides sp. GY 10113]TIC88854.1 amino acid transporter [Nocardioides sp. GY 10113]
MLLDQAATATPARPASGPRSGLRSGLAPAVAEAGPVWIGVGALGVGLGVLSVGTGFPWWFSPLVSLTLFAGSAEFLLIGMWAVGAPLLAVGTTTFMVNARHLFYGLSFPLGRVRGRWGKAYSVFSLTDEAFAMLSTKAPAELSTGRILWTQAGTHLSWAGGSLLGSVLGASLLQGLEGLDFVLTALFLVLALDAFRAAPDRLGLMVAVAAAAGAMLLFPGAMLLVAMVGFGAAMAVRHHARRLRPVAVAGA